MATNIDAFDTQIIAENVSFLDHCFDNSFTINNSLNTVKFYAANAKDNSTIVNNNNRKRNTKKNFAFNSEFNRSCKDILSQPKTSDNVRKLTNWGLPFEIVKKYEAKGITQMFDWQVSCLNKPTVMLDYRNLVYSAPTSAGKTLVAEILTVKTVLERQKKVLIILPFVSIVREKMFYLQDILSSSGIRVEGFMGSQSPPGGLQAVHIAICTIEKANSLINKLIDEHTISELGAVVVDELHLLGDPHRGYILELLLTKIKYISLKMNEVKIQIVGMSATLPNLEVLAEWLDADLFITDFRPIPLEEYCLVGNKFYDKSGQCVKSMESSTRTREENESVLHICLETIKEGCSVLIFCMTKNRCENLAQGIASTFFKWGSNENEMGSVLRSQLKPESIGEVLEQLKNCPVGLDNILKNVISFGVSYHHAGLTFDERDIIEGAFKAGAIRVLVATSTLSSGVNLPARRVIVRTPMFQKQPLNILTYKQMIGRAGRMGKDIKGESILVCTETEKKVGLCLMEGILDPVQSCIESEDKFMRAILEIIASQVICTIAELDLYIQCSLFFYQENKSSSQMLILKKTLEQLQNFELIRLQNTDNDIQYLATSLGKACLSSSMAPNDGLSLFCELQKARQCVVLETDLHLIYLVTPYSVSNQWNNIDWLHLLTLWESLTRAMRKVGELVGIQESFIIQRLRAASTSKVCQNKLSIHKRFYTALALQDLVNEVPLSEVAEKFQCARGFLQGLQQAAATFAGMVTSFCHQLGWKNMELLISQFQDRLHFGIQSELIELMKLPSLNGIRARALFDNGFETISSIASGNVNTIENIIFKAVPFQSEKGTDGDDKSVSKKHNKSKNIWITGFCGVTAKEAARNLISEARKYLQQDIGVTEIKWEDTDIKTEQRKCSQKEINYEGASEDKAILSEKNHSTCIEFRNGYETVLNNTTNTNKEQGLQNMIECSRNKIKDVTEFYTKISLNVMNTDVVDKCSSPLQECNFLSGQDGNDIIVINDSPLIDSIIRYANKSPSILNKEDVVWESLNFTALDNLSKFRTTHNESSPEISFGDNELVSDRIENDARSNHLKNASAKDVSLFSSDGNDSNLFDETLPVELLPNTFTNCNDKMLKEELLKNCKVNGTNNVTIDSRSILNAFTSSIAVNDDDEDIKLVYEEDKKEIINFVNINASQNIEVINSQAAMTSLNYKSHLKRQIVTKFHQSHQPLLKKVKKIIDSESDPKVPFLKSKLSKYFTIEMNGQVIQCYILREIDITEFYDIIQSRVNASIYLDIRKSLLSNEVIGSNLFRNPENKQEAKVIKHNDLIKGIAVCFSNELCIYIDFTSITDKLQHVKEEIGQWLAKKNLYLKLLSLKSAYVHVKYSFGIELTPHCLDLSLTEWLIQSDEKIVSIDFMVNKYCHIDLSNELLKIKNEERKFQSLDSITKKLLKAFCVWAVAEKQQKILFEQYCGITDVASIEMHVAKILGDCEYNGLAIDRELVSKLLIDVKNSQEILQKKAYKLCGYHFNFNSSKDVAKVLGIYRGRKVSTKKSVLTAHNSPMASIVIYWRKLNAILTKTLYPLTDKASNYGTNDRISPVYTMHTCTGRITMHEPNLQNVPRTFSIPLKYLTLTSENDHCTDVIEYNCRKVFKAEPGCVFISADYCQLEMRILTHYSRDPVLTAIMRSDVDVFKAIAASWSSIPEEQVDDDLRQKAKQLCYGILYGMGNKTLSQHLDVTEAEAAVFMDSFYKTYPSVKMYTQSIIDTCRELSYVETLKKRRRYLPDITSHLAFKRSAAERQAVNTTIQGSAADIAKAAMCAIDKQIEQLDFKPRLILQMHDELIYEVTESAVDDFSKILKRVMEDTVCLQVPLPVKVRSGPSWGALTEIKL